MMSVVHQRCECSTELLLHEWIGFTMHGLVHTDPNMPGEALGPHMHLLACLTSVATF